VLCCLEIWLAGAYQLATVPSKQPVVYFAIPMLWGAYNAVPYYVLTHYLYTNGPSLRTACYLMYFWQVRTVAAGMPHHALADTLSVPAGAHGS
jgi:hypothetical protein